MSYNCDDAEQAGRLIALAIKRDVKNREYIENMARYNRDPDFEKLVVSFCIGLGLNKPLYYSADDVLLLSPSSPISPFAIRMDFFENTSQKERPVILMMFLTAISLFWPDQTFRGDQEESEWISENDLVKAVKNFTAENKSRNEDSLWQAIFTLRERMEVGRSDSWDMRGFARKTFKILKNSGLAIIRIRDVAITEEGEASGIIMEYRASPWLCAMLLSPAWEELDQAIKTETE